MLTSRLSGFAFTTAALLALLAGCSGIGPHAASLSDAQSVSESQSRAGMMRLPGGVMVSPAPRVELLPTKLHALKSWAAPLLNTHIPVLYVAGATCSCVLVYSQRGTNRSPIGVIGGMSDARGLFVDKEGELYVGNSLAHTVPIYEEAKLLSPVKTLQDPGYFPSDVAVDSDGTIYVVNQNDENGGPGSLSVYAHGSILPTSHLTPHANTFVDSVALDDHHNVFAGYGDPQGVGRIDEFLAGSTNPIQLVTTVGYTGGMEVDHTGDLLVADPDFFNGCGCPVVDIFDVNIKRAETQFGKRGWPYYVGLNKAEHRLYVTDALNSEVREYSYPAGKLIDTITKGLEGGNYPVGVALAHPGPL